LLWITLALCQCSGGLQTCPDMFRGDICFDSTYASCVMDKSLGVRRLCGKGLSSCGGVCFQSGLFTCLNSVLVSSTATEVGSEDLNYRAAETHSTTSKESSESTTSTSSTTRQPARTDVSVPAPNPGPGGAPPPYRSQATSATSSTSSVGNNEIKAQVASKATTSTSSSTSYVYQTKTRQPARTNVPVPAPNPGPGGAPPRYSPSTTTTSPVLSETMENSQAVSTSTRS